jgi:hypothetical protein
VLFDSEAGDPFDSAAAGAATCAGLAMICSDIGLSSCKHGLDYVGTSRFRFPTSSLGVAGGQSRSLELNTGPSGQPYTLVPAAHLPFGRRTD